MQRIAPLCGENGIVYVRAIQIAMHAPYRIGSADRIVAELARFEGFSSARIHEVCRGVLAG
ncbi:MAG: hypothetical protein QM811_04090 [Pirellulales bacterium]